MNKNNPKFDDRTYAIAILLGCIDSLARDLAIEINSDPNYLVTKSMLKTAFSLQYQGLVSLSSNLEKDYGWLIDQVENLIY